MSTWKSCCSSISQRWVFAVLAGLGICIGSILQVILSITIIEMVVHTGKSEGQFISSCGSTGNITSKNDSFIVFRSGTHTSNHRYSWDEYTQGIILSSFFWSYVISQCLSGSLSERFGGKYLYGFGIFIPSILTFITPFAISWGGSTALIVTRVLMGVVNGGMYPHVSTMITNWTTPADRTKIGSAIYAGNLLGLFLGTLLPVLIIKYSAMGWPAVFYFFGIVGTIWFPLWMLFVYENAQSHPFISDEEKEYLRAGSKKNDVKTKLPPTPWKEIFTSKEFWAYTFALFGSDCAYFAMFSDLPKYLNNVVGFSLLTNGYFSALPHLLKWLNTMASTWASDKILENGWMSLTSLRKLFATISLTGPGVFILLASYAECDKTLVIVMFVIGITLSGCLYPSVMMNALDLSPNYAGSIMSVGNGLATVVGMITPYVIGVLTPNSTIDEWRLVFWIVFLFAVLSNAVYIVWFEAEVKPWNDRNFSSSEVKNKELEEVKKELMP